MQTCLLAVHGHFDLPKRTLVRCVHLRQKRVGDAAVCSADDARQALIKQRFQNETGRQAKSCAQGYAWQSQRGARSSTYRQH